MTKFNLGNLFKVRSQGALSIDFGQLFVKIAYLEYSGEEFKLINYDCKKISPEKKDKEEAIEFINDFLKTNSIAERETYLTICESVIIKHLLLPKVPKEEVADAIKWQLKEEVPFDIQRCAFDWRLIKEYKDEQGLDKEEIVFIAVKDEAIKKYLSVANKCNLNLLSVTSAAFNYANILSYLNAEKKPQAVLELNHTDSNLYIYDGNGLRFTRRLNFSPEKIVNSLTGVPMLDKTGKIQLSYEEAQELKDAFGILQDENAVLKNNIAPIHIISLMRPLLEELTRELRYSLEYFISKFNTEDIPALYLAGEEADLKNLDGYLKKEFKINIAKLPIPHSIDTGIVDKERLQRDQNIIISSLGAVMTGRGAINFIPAELKIQKIEVVEKAFLRLVAFTAGLALLFSLSVVRFQIRNYNKRLMNARNYLQALGEIKVVMQKLQPYEGLALRVQRGGISADGILKLISMIVPPEAVLNEISLEQEAASLTLKGVVGGNKNNADRVLSGFMHNIESSPFLTQPQIIASQGDGKTNTFEIKCNLAY